MPPLLRVRVTAKSDEGPCAQCEEPIPRGRLHISVIQGMGESEKGKRRWKGSHLHFSNCFLTFLVVDHLRWSTRKKKPLGRKGPEIPDLLPEQRGRRQWLIRTRSRLIREVAFGRVNTFSDIEGLQSKYNRITEVGKEIVATGGIPRTNKVHRPDSTRQAYAARIEEYHLDKAKAR